MLSNASVLCEGSFESPSTRIHKPPDLSTDTDFTIALKRTRCPRYWLAAKFCIRVPNPSGAGWIDFMYALGKPLSTTWESTPDSQEAGLLPAINQPCGAAAIDRLENGRIRDTRRGGRIGMLLKNLVVCVKQNADYCGRGERRLKPAAD
jgi:hypothetical protein